MNTFFLRKLYHILAMIYNYNEDYQYDSCVSQGVCSVNPRTSSLQEVLILYLKLASYYAIKLYENGIQDNDTRNMILNTISILVSNFEFSERDFKVITEGFNKTLPALIKKYEETCKGNNIVPECLKSILKFKQSSDIIKSIQFGEKEFLKKTKSLSAQTRDLYKILFVLAKSVCINVLDLESFGIEDKTGYISILKLLNSLNTDEHDKDADKLKTLIEEISVIDNTLMKTLQNVKEKRYGAQQLCEVSYSTVPGKAVLVVGSNIRELEDILEAFKNKKIDVYTHDEMILANTFPKFKEYKNLKGQYGQGIENCLLDFATFPGPIILTRHSLYNVKHLYRGLLYTTDFATSKGVIPIKNRDFSQVIAAAENAKGFKTGRHCETLSVGYDYDKLIKTVKQRAEKYSGIFIVGIGAYTLESKAYFEKLLAKTPENILVISLSYCIRRENIICLNACFDTFAVTKITEGLAEELSIPISVFFPKCDRHTISQMIYLNQKHNINIYVGKCTPIMLNPNMMITLKNLFNINSLTSVKKDLDEILKK